MSTAETTKSRSIAIIVLALAAASVASYLGGISLRQAGLPVGCGEGGGCAEVLRSKWASFFGVSVTFLALPVYLGILAAGTSVTRQSSRFVLLLGATIVFLAAIWFLVLQAFVVGAWCPWCLVEHTLGLLLVAAIAVELRRPPKPERAMLPVMLGASAFTVLALAQIVATPPSTTVRRDGDVGTQSGKTVTLLDGHLVLDQAEPSVGDPSAANTIYIMLDYCCPHCRRTHGYLLDAIQKHPGRLRVVCLPMPRDADCNSEITETESRFEHACELATLALSVWELNPEKFAELDSWLFESEKPRSPQEARAQAQSLLNIGSDDALQAQLDQAEVVSSASQRLQRNVKAFNSSNVQYLPVLMAPGLQTVVGRPESPEAIMRLIEDELFKRETDAN